MDTVTAVFLVIGAVGIGLLALSLLGGELLHALHLGDASGDGPFSLPTVAGFVGAFGFGGAIAAELLPGTGLDLVAAGGVGLAAALPAAWLAMRLARSAMNMRTDDTPTQDSLVGSLGVVVTRIPEGSYGEVRVRIAGQQVKFNARAAKPLASGTAIFVLEALSPSSVVVDEVSAISPSAAD